MSAEHILDAIDGALAWDGDNDEMRWRPPGQEPPPPPKPVFHRRRTTRITIIIEEGDEVTVVDVPNPTEAEYRMDVHEDIPHWQSLSFSAGGLHARTEIGVQMEVNPDEGFTTYRGRDQVKTVLRRISGDEEGATP